MSKFIAMVLAGTTLFWTPQAAHADEASKNAKIEEMMHLTQADRMMTQVLDQMKGVMMNQVSKQDMPPEAREAAEEMQKKMMALIADRLSWDKAKPAYIKMYA